MTAVALRACELLRDHGIERIEKLPFDPPPTVNSIVSGVPYSIITVFFPQAVDQSILRIEDLIYKSSGVLAGFSKIELIVYPGSFSAALYVEASADEIPGKGFAEFYRAPLHDYERIAENEIRDIEKAAGYSFSAAADIEEYHQGEGDIMLNRIPLNSLISVQDLAGNAVDLSRIEIDHEAGLLYPKNGSWPSGRLRITGNFGFDTMPEDVIEAAANRTAAGILSDDLGITGDVQSESAEGYSYSAGPGGKYGGVKSQFLARSNSILSKYITGVHGS